MHEPYFAKYKAPILLFNFFFCNMADFFFLYYLKLIFSAEEFKYSFFVFYSVFIACHIFKKRHDEMIM